MRARWTLHLYAIFGVIVLSFGAVTAFTQWRLARIDAATLQISETAVPSIEQLVVARGELRYIQRMLRQSDASLGTTRSDDEAGLGRSLDRVDGSVAAYFSVPPSPGEQQHRDDVSLYKDRLHAAVGRYTAERERGDLEGARGILHGDVTMAADALAMALMRTIEFHAKQSGAAARRIRALRASSARGAVALDVGCVLIAVFGAVGLRRAVDAHDELARRHRQMVEERATELEDFAGRIAHDILSPLGNVSLALELSSRAEKADERRSLHERALRSVARVQALVDGLLRFARAGAKPEPGARADVATAIDDVVIELAPALSDAGVELRVETHVSCPVACAGGVLQSVVANLAHNAIKYIGDRPVRRLEIRAREDRQLVHVEVQDTGPGLAPGLEERVFEPYVRGRASRQPGIGLGLATVKRLVEGHGGRVGVESTPGTGCTFWFELPRAAEEASTGLIAAAEAARVETSSERTS